MDSDPRLARRLQIQRLSQSKLHLSTGRHGVCGTRDGSTASRLVSSAVQMVGTGRFDRDRAPAELHAGEVDGELLCILVVVRFAVCTLPDSLVPAGRTTFPFAVTLFSSSAVKGVPG